MKNRIHLGCLLAQITVCFLLPNIAGAWWSIATGGDTHYDIVKDVMNNSIDSSAYPDLVKFKNQIETGANDESHDIPDTNHIQWWSPNPEVWFTSGVADDGFTGAFYCYTNYNFADAYKRIGYELHLVQDQDVPAHQRFCNHGYFDDLEKWACAFHSYASSSTPWTYTFNHVGGSSTFNYWLDDSMDDDDRNETASDANDEADVDGPSAWGVADSKWGTYGQPQYTTVVGPGGIVLHCLSENLPGQGEGCDYFGEIPGNRVIIYEQLKKSYDATLLRMKQRSLQLPPLVPDADVKVSTNLFGPNQPVDISFIAMENRLKTVKITILAGSIAIKDTGGRVWDGTSSACYDLDADGGTSNLPWKSTITRSWNGDSTSGLIADGQYALKIYVKDLDGHLSEERTRNVKFDKTKPEATISITKVP